MASCCSVGTERSKENRIISCDNDKVTEGIRNYKCTIVWMDAGKGMLVLLFNSQSDRINVSE